MRRASKTGSAVDLCLIFVRFNLSNNIFANCCVELMLNSEPASLIISVDSFSTFLLKSLDLLSGNILLKYFLTFPHLQMHLHIPCSIVHQ